VFSVADFTTSFSWRPVRFSDPGYKSKGELRFLVPIGGTARRQDREVDQWKGEEV